MLSITSCWSNARHSVTKAELYAKLKVRAASSPSDTTFKVNINLHNDTNRPMSETQIPQKYVCHSAKTQNAACEPQFTVYAWMTR
jgi:hypothetical protein